MASDPGQIFRENIEKLKEKCLSDMRPDHPILIIKHTELDDLCRAVDAELDHLRGEVERFRHVGIIIERGLPSNSEDGGWGGPGDPSWAGELRQAIADTAPN